MSMTDLKLGVVSTYPELSTLVQKIASDLGLTFELKEGVLEEGVSYAYQLEHKGVDVIISRGVTGKKIKKEISLPVVLIEITAFDILQALYAAKSKGKKIAFLGHKSMDFSPEFDSITQILNICVDRYGYENIYDMQEQMERILQANYDVVVSTGLCVYDMAQRSGVEAVLVKSGYDAVYSAIKRAIEIVQGIQREQERLERFRAVLELTSDGILILDKNQRISFINPSAEKLLGIDAEKYLGCSTDKLHRSSLFGPLLNTNNKIVEITKENERKQFWVSSMPINIKGQEKGRVITFQSAYRIQTLEQNIRKQLFKKGLVAKYKFSDIVGKSHSLQEAISRAKKFAATNATILIYGESGTGKELFAQSIHNESARCHGPFVAINCAAIPENLLESELFGYDEGAFTGARKGGKSGLFEIAHGGTIFLDEISEMTPSVQARLLRVLQEREVMRLGSDRVIPVDVRVIAATNSDLSIAVREGKFRSDLYHRLEVLTIEIPPLRVRKEDIDLLANHFIKQFSIEQNKEVPLLSKQSLEKLKEYDWPGNVRELQNVIYKYVLLYDDSQDNEKLISKLVDEKMKKSFNYSQQDFDTITLKIGKLDDMEREIIAHLKSRGYTHKEISRLLGTSRTTLWRKGKTHSESFKM